MLGEGEGRGVEGRRGSMNLLRLNGNIMLEEERGGGKKREYRYIIEMFNRSVTESVFIK